MMKLIKIFVVSIIFLVISINGCLRQIPTIGEYTNYWVGKPVEEKKKQTLRSTTYASRIGWKEKTYKLDNGSWVYVEPDSKNCFIHWEVNPEGIIVSYKLEGNCH